MKNYQYVCIVFLMALAQTAQAQYLRGTVRDADSGAPLGGVNISLGQTPDIDHLAISSDNSGAFYTDALRPGYYRIFFTLTGFEPRLIPEILIVSGKETQLEVAMRRMATTLPDITVIAAPAGHRPLQALGEIPLTREQTLRFPATFFDPARLALAYAGTANTDDQANGLSVRGNGPAALRWRLEGIDVVNPNHLPNAGTFNDRAAGASGGVLLFSAQLLDNSSLLTGAFPAGYGEALGGIMDMAWRRGNRDRHEFTLQAGLLGLDLAAEGPLGKQSRHAYLANYRYSTVGLLGQMGVSFGGEKINFQDFSFKVDFAGKNGGLTSVFGAGGLSENIFTPPTDSAEVEVYKDLFNIDFHSRTGIAGISHWAPVGRNMWWKITGVASGQRNTRAASGAGIREDDENTENRLGIAATVFRKLNEQNRLQAGVYAQSIDYDVRSDRDTTLLVDGNLPASLLQPWASWEWSSLQGKTSVRVGLHGVFFNIRGRVRSGDSGLEPRLLISRRLGKHGSLALAWGMHSQLAPLWLYANRVPIAQFEYPNRDLGLTRSQQASLRYAWQSGEAWAFKAEFFYQKHRDVPVSSIAQDAFSMVNISEVQALPLLSPSGRAENKGVELTAERYLGSGWFLLANTSLFDARYRGSDAVWRDSRWNLRHIVNVTAGKEWLRDQWPRRSRAFGFNGRFVWQGGQRAAPVDLAQSVADQRTVFDLSQGYTIQQPGFLRFDVRVYWRRHIGARRNSTFAMDFQNISIRKNVAYQYYDPYTKLVETKYQLGLVPNLGWRLEF